MKAYVLQVLVVDFNNLGPEGIKDALEYTHYPNRCIHPSVGDVEEHDIGEWDDSHPLNKMGDGDALAWLKRHKEEMAAADRPKMNPNPEPHPENCPICGERYKIQCRCLRSDRKCPNGHEWHRCLVHGKTVMGPSDHSGNTVRCTCLGEKP